MKRKKEIDHGLRTKRKQPKFIPIEQDKWLKTKGKNKNIEASLDREFK